MRSAAAVALAVAVAVPAVAHAQSVLAPAQCEVHILRAPDATRSAIEGALRNLTCDASLVVRVVPTDKGLYLIAEEPNGRTYERVVGDDTAAAAQVREWARPQVGAVADLLPPAANDPTTRALRPPAAAPARAPERVERVAAAPTVPYWLSIGGILGDGTEGVRGEVDIVRRGGFALGLAVEASAMHLVLDGSDGGTFAPPLGAMDLSFRDVRGVVTVGYTLGRGAWQLRSHLGIGMIRSQLDGFSSTMGEMDALGNFATGEGSLQVVRTLGTSWALTAGPLATLYHQDYHFAGRELDVSAFAALRRRL
jgi:hypothetical protein